MVLVDLATTYFVIPDRVRPVVDEQMIVAVQGEFLEAEHKLLQNSIRLKRDGTVEIILRLARDDGPIDLLVERVDALAKAKG